MNRMVSMLRGINVGGQKKISMEALRQLYAGLGFANVRSYVQSGNMVFECSEQDPARLARQIEAAIERTWGFSVAVFIRSSPDLQRILANNPFVRAGADPGILHVTFLYQEPSPSSWSKLIAPANIPDEFARDESAIYLFCPNGYGKTKLSNTFFERKLGVAATTRNWNTVKALYKMVSE